MSRRPFQFHTAQGDRQEHGLPVPWLSAVAPPGHAEILHVVRTFDRRFWGGTQEVVLSLARETQRRGVPVEVLTTRTFGAAAEARIDEVYVRRFQHFYTRPLLGAAGRERLDLKGGGGLSLGLFGHILRAPAGTVVHNHVEGRLGGLVLLASRLRGLPFVHQLHAGYRKVPDGERRSLAHADWHSRLDPARLLAPLVTADTRVLVARAHGVITMSSNEVDDLARERAGRPLLPIPNGVACLRFAAADGAAFRARHGIGGEERVVVSVARLDSVKGQDQLIAAFARLPGRPRLLLVGPESVPGYRDALRRQAAELGVVDRITFVTDARPDDIPSAYAAGDVFCLASRYESFGLAILEAWATCVPAVATAVGGVPGFVRDGVDALLVPPEDPSALAAALGRVLDDPTLATGLGLRGRARACAEFDWSALIGRVLDFYRELDGGA